MKTYQDLLKCRTETDRRAFIEAVISWHQSTEQYKTGTTAGLFYRHRDPDLEAIHRYIYDRTGQAYEDTYTADNRITANFFYLLLTQTVMYLLGNGISFENPDIKEVLGGRDDFDFITQKIAMYAGCDGEAYGYVSEDENGEKDITPMCYACRIDGNEPLFCPLPDENDGVIRAGVRYWRIDPDKPRKIVLYEEDGYTKYTDTDHGLDFEGWETGEGGKKYYGKERYNEVEGVYSREQSDISGCRIIKMPYINNQSAIVGNRTLLFAYDVVFSGMINKMDMNTLYWLLKNADGMSRQDDLNFVADLIKTHVLHLQEGQDITPHEINTNTAAYQSVLAEIRSQLFLNFMCIDTERISGGNITATQIKTSYQNADLQANALERCVSEFIRDVLEIYGFDRNEKFHFIRDKAINESEHINNLIAAAQYLDNDTTTRAVATTLGMIDEAENIIEKKQQEEQEMMMAAQAAPTMTEPTENVGGT